MSESPIALSCSSLALFGRWKDVKVFLIDKTGRPKLYLYDKTMKPLEKTDLQTKLTVKAHDGAQHSRELKVSNDPKEGGVYKGEPIKGVSDWDTAVVSRS